jgi:hypothetical protein
MVWPRFLGGRARFGLHSWREGTLDSVRHELDAALGVALVPCDDKVYDGRAAFECSLPACELRLNSWPSLHADLQVVNFIGIPSEDLEQRLPSAEEIDDALASHLRSAGCDWYVPDKLEYLEAGGVLGDRLLDAGVIASIAGPRWLAWVDGEEKDAGMQQLKRIAERWLSVALRTPKPIAELKRRWAALEERGRHVAPRSRLQVLAAYPDKDHAAR